MAYAQSGGATASARDFNIRSQQLVDAMREFSQATGIQVVYTASVGSGVAAGEASGSFSAAEALSRILTGTGLTYRFTGANAVTLEPAPQSTDGVVRLGPVRVEGDSAASSPTASQFATATGPVGSYVARRSASATKTDTPLIETPASISVVTREQMDVQQVKTISQALRYTAGVTADIAGSQVIADQFIVRGFQQGAGRVLKDGLRMFPSDYLGWDAPEPYGLERVEILRGASSVLYGASDPGGQINLISKRAPQEPLYQLQLQRGSFDYWHAAGDIGGPLDKDGTLSYRLTGLYRESDAQVDFIHNRRIFVAPTVTWRPDSRTELTILTEYQKQTGNFANPVPADGSLFSNPNGHIPRNRNIGDPDFDRSSSEKWALGYAFDHQLSEAISLRQNLRYTHVRHDSAELFFLSWVGTAQRSIDRFSDERRGSGDIFSVDTQVEGRFQTGPLSHTLLAGLDYNRTSYDQWQRLGYATPLDLFTPVYGNVTPFFFPASEYEQTIDQTGLYLQDQVKLGGKWVMLLGGRYDWVRNANSASWAAEPVQKDGKFTGRAGLVYLADNGLAPYLSFSQSFLPATGRTFDNQIFRPETGRQYEAGVKYQPTDGNSLYTIAVFDLTKDNVSTTDPLHPGYSIQDGRTRSRGVEAEAKLSVAAGFNLLATFSWNDVKVMRSNESAILGNRPFRVPEHQASLWSDYSITTGAFSGLSGGGGFRYIGSSYGDRENSFKVPSYTVVDAFLRYAPPALGGLSLELNASNLFDKGYIAGCFNRNGCQYGQGRNIYVTLAYDW